MPCYLSWFTVCMNNMRSNHSTVYVCQYHVVFGPKYRCKVLVPQMDERLKIILTEQIERWGQDLIELEVRPDHVHLPVGCDPSLAFTAW
jgi:putative transposase